MAFPRELILPPPPPPPSYFAAYLVFIGSFAILDGFAIFLPLERKKDYINKVLLVQPSLHKT